MMRRRVEADRELERWVTKEIPDLCKKHNRPDPRSYNAEWHPEASSPELLLPLECPSEMEANQKQWRRKWAEAGVPVSGMRITDSKLVQEAEAYNQSRTSGRLADFQVQGTKLRQVILEDLKAAIAERYPEHVEIKELGDLQKEIDQQEQFLHTSSEGFISRGDDFAELDAYADGDEKRLFVLTAPGGMGKSTLLANWIEHYRVKAQGKSGQSIHFRFIGQSDRSTSVYSLLYFLMREFKEVASKLTIDIPDDPQKLRQELPKLLEAIGRKGRTFIVLDALNQLESGLSDLSWLPYQLPENVKLVVSFKRGEPEADELLQNLQGSALLAEVKPFVNLDDRRKLVRAYLAQYLKDLDERHLETLITTEGAENPLFLKVVLSELRVFGAFANLGEKIRLGFGETPITAFHGVLKRLENDPAYSPIDPKQAVPLLFGLLAHARQGLSLDELTSLFVQEFNKTSQEAQDTINLYLRQVRSFLAHRDGRYDFFFESFKLAAQGCYVGETSPQRPAKEWHRLLAEYFVGQPLMVEKDGNRYPYMYKLSEQPYQCTQANLWSDVFGTLTDFDFLEAKCRVMTVYGLEVDYMEALKSWQGDPVKKDVLIALEERLRWKVSIFSNILNCYFQCFTTT